MTRMGMIRREEALAIMAETNSFDLIVIGSGPGGYVAAIRAAQLGMRTAVVEREELGGVCLNWGCIPTKALLTNARVYEHLKDSEKWGIQVQGLEFDSGKIMRRSRDVAEGLSRGVSYLMRKNKIEVVPGQARFSKPGLLTVTSREGEERQLSGKKVIIATGARARPLPGLQIDGERVLSYREALVLRTFPRSMIVIGGGAIGVEFAYFYSTFGTEVTVVEMMDHLLPVGDEEVSAELQKSFKKRRIKVLLGSRVTDTRVDEAGVTVTVQKDSASQTVTAETALVAIGVIPNVEDLDLEKAGVTVRKNGVAVDRWFKTEADGIYAIGDVIGPPWLAHVASHEGITCVEKIANLDVEPLDYRNMPGCTYCQPQVASLGLTENKAKQEGYRVKVGKFPFQVLGKARASQATEGFVKLVFDEKHGELLGAHIIGEEATEMISELLIAKKLETTYLELLKSVHPHPTLSEAVMEAAGMAYGEQIHL
jgi:dihydrolipoamide dehydrogenase